MVVEIWGFLEMVSPKVSASLNCDRYNIARKGPISVTLSFKTSLYIELVMKTRKCCKITMSDTRTNTRAICPDPFTLKTQLNILTVTEIVLTPWVAFSEGGLRNL